MNLIDQAHRDQHGADTKIEPALGHVVEGQKLDRNRAASSRARVLEFELGVDQPLIVELITDVEHGPKRIEDVVILDRTAGRLRLGHKGFQQDFTVTANAQPLVAVVNLGGSGAEAAEARVLAVFGNSGRRDGIFQLFGEHLDGVLKPADSLFIRLFRLGSPLCIGVGRVGNGRLRGFGRGRCRCFVRGLSPDASRKREHKPCDQNRQGEPAGLLFQNLCTHRVHLGLSQI